MNLAWADYLPEWQYALKIEWCSSNTESREAFLDEENDISEIEEELDDAEKSFSLPILNSFFFEDIEDAIRSLKKHPCSTLNTYLSENTSKNPDLCSQEGIASIIDKLHPMKISLGRWPSLTQSCLKGLCHI